MSSPAGAEIRVIMMAAWTALTASAPTSGSPVHDGSAHGSPVDNAACLSPALLRCRPSTSAIVSCFARRAVCEQVAWLAVQHRAQPGQRAEPHGPGMAVLQDRQVHDSDADPFRELGQGHLALHEQLIEANPDPGCLIVRGGRAVGSRT